MSASSAATPAPLSDVILAGEQSFAGQLAALGDNTLRFTAADGEPREVSPGAFVRWANPRDPVRRPRILLTDGSELVADLSWTTDGSVQLADDQMQVRTSLLGRVTLPSDTIRGVLFDAARDPVVADRMLSEMRAAEPLEQDQLWLVNGDRLAGEIGKIDGAEATLKLADQSIDVPLTNLSAVSFHQPNSAPAEPARWALGLQDGTLLRAASATGDEKRLHAKLAAGIEISGKSLSDIVFLQNLAGDGFTYVSEMEPIDYKHTPYFNLAWPLAVDENLLSQPLRADDKRYLKGVAMHSASRAVYRLAGNERTFESTIALDDTAGNAGSVIYRVYTVRNGKSELAFESDIVRGGDAPQPISVNLTGAQGLVLLVDYADYGDQQDHANWLDARVVR
ncbi:MAG: NPCBM/NEW2 domain-containing protein [Pirellulales bacterium]